MTNAGNTSTFPFACAFASVVVAMTLVSPSPVRGGTSQGFATLVKDINKTTKPSHARWFAAVNEVVFFLADDGVHGQELWISDGSSAGTTMVADIIPGSSGTDIYRLTPGRNRLYFVANDGVHGEELWSSDGTEAGTALVRDVVPGPSNSSPYRLVAAGDLLFFGAVGAASYLWRSDGTEAGTYPLDLATTGGTAVAAQLVAASDRLFVIAETTAEVPVQELWVTDGTAAGTARLRAFGELPYSRPNLAALDRNVIFAADDLVHGFEPWISDGTPEGTQLIDDLVPGPESSNPVALGVLGGALLFVAGDSVAERALWRTDGTAAGTSLVSRTVPDLESWHARAGDLYYYLVRDARYRRELWRTDGTTDGTRVILRRPSAPPWIDPAWLTGLGDALLFSALDPQKGVELWRSDGTEEGTALLRDIWPGYDLCHGYPRPCPFWLEAAGGTVFFAADDKEHGLEVWNSDGTEAGTALVRDVRPGTNSASPLPHGELDGRLIFSADDGQAYSRWITDGTEAGTARLQVTTGERTPAPQPQSCGGIRLGDAFYSLYGGAAEDEGLWRCTGDGTGRTLVRTINPAGYELIAFAGKLFFRAWTEGLGAELWVSDGTATGTHLFVDVNPAGSALAHPVEPQFTTLGDLLLFVADDGAHGPELWRTDGTEVGTVLVHDVHTGANGSAPQPIIPGPDLLYFVADDGQHGRELWSTDGTDDGTLLISDINPGRGGSFPETFAYLNGHLVFAAHSDASGTELWQSDGTTAGTRLLRDIKPGRAGSFPSSLLEHDGRIFFAANDGDHGWEVWSTDGSATGTVLVHDVSAGTLSAFFTTDGDDYDSGQVPRPRLQVAGGLLAFVADDGTNGRELWTSDGTDAGTALVHDVAPGSVSSDPQYPVVAGPHLFFTADQEATGRELWVAKRSDLSPPCVGDCGGDWQVEIANLVKGVRIAQGDDPVASCPPFDADSSATVGITELVAGVQNSLDGCHILVQRLPPTVPLPHPTPTPPVLPSPSTTGHPTPPDTPSPAECVRTGCSGELCEAEHQPSPCWWFAEFGCLRDATCGRQPDGCGFVFERGARAHRCLIALGRCAFDDDCATGWECRRERDAWGTCARVGG